MNTITISGHSDDCIEVDGDVSEEFYAGPDDTAWIRLNCGTIIQVTYDDNGRWRTTIILPTPGFTIDSYYRAPVDDPEDRDYTDKLTISGDLLPIRFYSDASLIDVLTNSVPEVWAT